MHSFRKNSSLSILFALLVLTSPLAQAQTFTVLHNFTGGQDGGQPLAGVTLDNAGNLYGTASLGGHRGSNCIPGCGTVFKLNRKNSQWVFTPLYSFVGGDDGSSPEAPVTIGPDGALYGTTSDGGNSNGGTVYRLRPNPGICKFAVCSWAETVLYAFNAGCCSGDGYYPWAGVVFDQAGNMYGTTTQGGNRGGGGTVYELSPAGLGWTESVLHGFGLPDGITPYSGVIFDSAGNLYGTTAGGGNGATVYELTPSGSTWTETILQNFSGPDGDDISAGLIFDQSGNLYGAGYLGGAYGNGTVFELTPSNGSWSISRLYSFLGGQANWPAGTLAMDAAGNVYGAGTAGGAYGFGGVFKLTPSNGSWTYTSLHDFSGNDGNYPNGSVTFDANGNLYGTTWIGGANGYGVVWEITP